MSLNQKRNKKNGPRHTVLVIVALLILAAFGLAGCGPSTEELEHVDYAPQSGENFENSTPQEQGLDPMLVARLYYNAEKVQTIKSLLVLKDGKLIAEKYYHDGAVDEPARIQSVTKSFTSALAGIAISQGLIPSVDEKAAQYFPELTVADPRKNSISIRQMLQMRAGFPWEESTPELFEILYHGFQPSLFADIPLASDPGTKFDYSNITSHLLGVVVARAAGEDLLSFANENLFGPLGIRPSEWIRDWEGYYNGHADLFITPRDMAKFGLLYLNEGEYNGTRILPEEWVSDSLASYSKDAWYYKIGPNVGDVGYGYQWWSATAGEHRYQFAWGHGGQQIALVDDLVMVIVVTADPLVGRHGDEPWKLEKENLNLVGDFIGTLPAVS